MAFKSLATSGIVNFAKYQNALVGNQAYNPFSFELISTTTLSSSSPSVTFDVSSLANTYKHLQLRIVGRSDRSASGGDYIRLRFNGDSGSNYSIHTLGANGGSVYSETQNSTTQMNFERIGASDLTSGNFGALIIDLLDPFSNSKFKTAKSLGGVSTNYVMSQSGYWASTSAITAVNVLVGGGNNLVSGSRFSIYGIKG